MLVGITQDVRTSSVGYRVLVYIGVCRLSERFLKELCSMCGRLSVGLK